MLCAAMSLSLLAGCGGGSDEGGKDAKKDGDAIKLGVLVYKYDDTYISTVRSAIEKYAKEADVEIKLDMQDGQGDQSKQNDQLDVLISKGVDALLINAVDTGSAQGLADKAKAADIPAVFFNREPAKEVVESCEGIFVGTTASEAGVMQGDMLADMYEADKEAIDKNGDGKIQYIVFKGEPGNPEAEARTEYAVKQAEERGLVMDNMGIEPLVANWMTDRLRHRWKLRCLQTEIRLKLYSVTTMTWHLEQSLVSMENQMLRYSVWMQQKLVWKQSNQEKWLVL